MTFDAQKWSDADPSADFEQKDPPPPGLYDVSVENARAFTSKQDKDFLVIELRAVSGRLEGHEWSVLFGFETEGAIKFAKGACERLGVDVAAVASLDELDTAVKGVVGEYLEVEVKQNGEYLNTYIQQRVTPGEPGTSDIPDDGAFQQPAQDPDTSKIPF